MCGRLSRPQKSSLSLIWFVLSVALRSAIRLRLTEILRIGYANRRSLSFYIFFDDLFNLFYGNLPQFRHSAKYLSFGK